MRKLFLILLILFISSVVNAAVDLPWSTTYDCNEWTYDGNDPTCTEELEKGLSDEFYADPSTACGVEQITSSANYPGGAGGLGQLHPVGGNGTNQASDAGGGTALYFNNPITEFWVRFYIKFESGFTWYDNSASIKLFYFHEVGTGDNTMVPKFQSADNFYFGADSGPFINIANRGWATVMGGTTGDGEWHYIEYRVKVDTDGTDGEIDLWIDDMAIQSVTGLDWDMDGEGYSWVQIAGNVGNIGNGLWNIYLDDVAISDSGKIGKLSSTPTTINPTGTPLVSDPTGTSVSVGN